MSSFCDHSAINRPTTVWRDALGPGFAVGAAEGLIRVAGSAALKPYHACR